MQPVTSTWRRDIYDARNLWRAHTSAQTQLTSDQSAIGRTCEATSEASKLPGRIEGQWTVCWCWQTPAALAPTSILTSGEEIFATCSKHVVRSALWAGLRCVHVKWVRNISSEVSFKLLWQVWMGLGQSVGGVSALHWILPTFTSKVSSSSPWPLIRLYTDLHAWSTCNIISLRLQVYPSITHLEWIAPLILVCTLHSQCVLHIKYKGT